MRDVQILGQVKQLLDILPDMPATDEARELVLDLIEELGAAIRREQQAIYGTEQIHS